MLPAVYVVSLLAGWLLSALRSEMTMVRMSSLLWVTATFFALELARHVVGESEPHVAGLVFLALASLTLIPLRRWWVFGRFDEAEARGALEQSLNQLRIAFDRTGPCYTLRTKAGNASLCLKTLPARHGALCLSSGGTSPKVALLRSLLIKRFAPLLPRPHIRFQ